MISVDVSEHKSVYNKCIEIYGKENIQRKKIGSWDCLDKNIPINDKCIYEKLNEVIIALVVQGKNKINKRRCISCDRRVYVRFADFVIEPNRAFFERKTAADAYSSLLDGTLYDQLDRMDTWIKGRKGLILEGMPKYFRIEDSQKAFWDKARDGLMKLDGKSPLQQAIAISRRPEWIVSIIKECAMRDIQFIQTYDLEETITFLIECDKGYDQEPKLRSIPKRRKGFPLNQNLLMLFNGVGKVHSERILKSNKKVVKILELLIKEMGKYKYVVIE